MAEFVAPQFQQPDILGSYLRGQQAGYSAQGAQQELQAGGLKLDQLRQTVQQQKMYQQIAQNALAQQPNAAPVPNQPGTGAFQSGPQGYGGDATGTENPLGMSNGTITALAVLRGDDPLKTAAGMQQYQQKQMQLQMQGPMNLVGTIARSPDANKIIYNNPQMKQQWNATAPQLGIDPNDPTQLTPDNARKVAQFAYNQMAGRAGLPSKDFGYSGTLKPGEAAYQNGQLVAGSPDAVTPFQQHEIDHQKQEMDLRKQEHGLAQQRFAFEQNQSKIPTGYQVSKEDPTKIEPIPGGPKDPNAAIAGGLGGRDGVMFQRVTSAANAGVKAIENIAEMPIAASSGFFGTSHPGTSLIGSVKSVMAQKITGQDAQTTNVMFSGLSRNLATLETAGLSPGGSLTESLGKLNINEGDTQMTKLRKLAEMRQIVEENLSPNLSNPKLAQTQKDLVKGIISKVTKAVPFTQHDITQFEASKNPRATIMDFAKSSGVQAQADSNHPPDIQSLLDKYK